MSTTFALNLGTQNIALDLAADFLNASAVVLSTTELGFTEIDGGQYLLTTTLPTGTVAVQFYEASDIDEYGIPTNPYCTIAVGPQATIPEAGTTGSVSAYLYTRNALGNVTGALAFNWQIVGVDSTYSDSWSNAINETTSDETGLVTVTFYVGTHVRYWVGNGRYKTVHITASTANPLALADVVGA